MEVWKELSGFDGRYQVSDMGRVKSLKGSEKILKQYTKAKGYKAVGLYVDKKQIEYKVHQLVAIAFLGHVRDGTNKIVVDHYPDRTKTNNNVNNLRLTTNRENCNRLHLPSTSKYVGVSWLKDRRKWQSRIQYNGKQYNLGNFKTEIEAHIAYTNFCIKNKIIY